MTVSKLTNPPSQKGVIDKINEVIDNLGGGGSATDVQINGNSITNNDIANIITNSAYNASSNKIATMSDVPSRNIGEIVASTLPLTDAGLHLLDGALLQYGSYQAFIDYIADLYDGGDYPDLFTTEANWQTAVTTYGVCGKFVYDSNDNTVRLPKTTGIIEGTTDVTALGDLVEAGLPNITGTFGLDYAICTGAFYQAGAQAGSNQSGGSSDAVTYFDASRSSSTYGNSTTVQPQTIKTLYYIVIATIAKTGIEVDIDEIATDLSGKADVDLTNCTKPHIVETYVNGTSWYRVYSDGWCEQGGSVTTTSSINVQFLKTFANTNYEPTLTVGESSAVDVWGDKPTVITSSLTTSSMNIFLNPRSGQYPTRTVYWQVCGYIS